MSSQGRVVAKVESDRDALAAWLMMKRGCRVIVLSDDYDPRILEPWDPQLLLERGKGMMEAIREHRGSAAVFGYGLDDFDQIKKIDLQMPVFYPLIGMTDEEMKKRLEAIKE